jgi:3-hydroxyacyl-CoA dehydrogenase/enoyl-CoA hydratase/3-hydroxybutyryl-CoA epimerase
VRKIAVIGAGFMGAGIAEVSARAGIDVVLIDRDAAAAEKGRATVESAYSRNVSRGRMKVAEAEAALDRVRAAEDYAAIGDADLVIEAVFEDRAVKEEVIRRVEAALPKTAIFGSNTSTLPITSLAKASARPANFIGIHFFSPVARMMLVEVIVGKKTGDAALARALDFIRAIRKTPIVVNDSRGFYTSRVVETYIGEGHRMLVEGVPPAMIENAGVMAGMPVGPLALNDEVALDLSLKIMKATRADLGDVAVPEAEYRLIDTMVTGHGRFGRKNGKGFYDYPANPRDRKRLWPGLADLFPPKSADMFDFSELKQRLLVIQALESARCFAEGVVTDVREADVGSILGFGFAPYTGGTLSYIDGMGAAAFVALCGRLARKHGSRFRSNRLLNEMAKKGETFYGRFPPPSREAS